jgi:hypothetical protein
MTVLESIEQSLRAQGVDTKMSASDFTQLVSSLAAQAKKDGLTASDILSGAPQAPQASIQATSSSSTTSFPTVSIDDEGNLLVSSVAILGVVVVLFLCRYLWHKCR